MRYPAVKLAVNEVRCPPEEQSDWGDHDEVVAEIGPRNFVSPRVPIGEDDQPDHPAVARHPSFPNAHDRERIAQHFRTIKEHVAEAAAEHHAKKRGPGNEVSNLLNPELRVTALREHAQQPIAANKRAD